MILDVFRQHAERCRLTVILRHKPHAYLIEEARSRFEHLRSSPVFKRTGQCAWMQEMSLAVQAQAAARRGDLGSFVPALPAHAQQLCPSRKRRKHK